MNQLEHNHSSLRHLALVAVTCLSVGGLFATWTYYQLPLHGPNSPTWANWWQTITPVDLALLIVGLLLAVALSYLGAISTLWLTVLSWAKWSQRRVTRFRLQRSLPVDFVATPENLNLSKQQRLRRILRIITPTWLAALVIAVSAPSVGALTSANSAVDTAGLDSPPVMVIAPESDTSQSALGDESFLRDGVSRDYVSHDSATTPVTTQPHTYLPRSGPITQVQGASEINPTTDEIDMTQSQTYTVQAGDHLWSIAASSMSHHLGRLALDSEIHDHWLELIATNRSTLVDHDNADLIYPGQELTVPPIHVSH